MSRCGRIPGCHDGTRKLHNARESADSDFGSKARDLSLAWCHRLPWPLARRAFPRTIATAPVEPVMQGCSVSRFVRTLAVVTVGRMRDARALSSVYWVEVAHQ